MSRRSIAPIVSVTSLVVLAGTAVAQPTTWRTVALQPELFAVPAALGPNLGAGVQFTWSGGTTTPSINANGEINFSGSTTQAGNPTGIWHWNGTVNNNVALYGTTTASGQLLTGFPGPVFGDSLNSSTWRASTGASVTTYVSNVGGSLSIIAQNNQPSVIPVAAGGTGTLNYSSLSTASLTSSLTGGSMFTASLVNSAGATSTGLVTAAGLTQNNTALFIGTPAGVTTIARQGTVMGNDAGTDYAIRAISTSNWTLNGPGNSIFQTTLQGTSINTTSTSTSTSTNPNYIGTRNDQAYILATRSTSGPVTYSLSTIARGGDAAPGAPAGVVFDTLPATIAMNDAGQFAFAANLRNQSAGVGGVVGASGATQNNSALFSNNGGSLTMIARQGQPVSPGSSVTLGSLSGTAQITSTGNVFFNANLAGTASIGTTSLCTFTPAGSMVEYLRTGQALPAFGTVPAGAAFSSFQSYATNAMGCVVVYGILQTNAALGIFSGPEGNNNRVLLAISPTGEYRLLARHGDAFDALNGGTMTASTVDARIISGINFGGGSAGQDGRTGGTNDSGQIAFGLSFSGVGTGGLYTATVVPTPGAPGLLGLVGLAASRRRR
ncbi:MAG: DUF7453 family protein [Phycisphaerales bacterium]